MTDDGQSNTTGLLLSHPQFLSLGAPNRQRQTSYVVPNTQTRLRIFFGRPMDGVILQSLLESVRSFCSLHISQDGDSWLPPDLDPYSRNGPYGGNVQVSSVHDRHLTYSILKATMQGLLNVLVIGDEEYDVDVEIFDLNGHLIGIGHVSERIKAGNLAIKGIKDSERRNVKRKKT